MEIIYNDYVKEITADNGVFYQFSISLDKTTSRENIFKTFLVPLTDYKDKGRSQDLRTEVSNCIKFFFNEKPDACLLYTSETINKETLLKTIKFIRWFLNDSDSKSFHLNVKIEGFFDVDNKEIRHLIFKITKN